MLLVWMALGLLALPAAAKRPVTLEELFSLREIGDVQVSPGDSLILFTVNGRLEQMPARGGSFTGVPDAPEGASNLRWSPDGRRAAFLARDAVWIFDVAAGRCARVCGYGHSNAFLSQEGNRLAWSPDGKRLAFAGTLDPPSPRQDPAAITRMQYKTRTALWDGRRTHIYVASAEGGTPRAITAGDWDEHSLDWGANGEIVFLSNREREPDARLNYDIFALRPETGTLRRLTSTPGVEMYPRVSPDGRRIAYLATTRALTTIDSVAEDAHVRVIPIEGGAAREVSPGLDRRCGPPLWTAAGEVVYTAGDHGKTVIYRGTQRVFDRLAQAGAVSAARDGALVYTVSDPAVPREIYRDGQVLTSLNPTGDWGLARPETFSFRSFDGTEVEGWFYPGTGRAMILSIHGGPHGMHGYGFNAAAQYYAARGYGTVAINPRGSSGYGQKFSDGCVRDWGGGDYRDLMAGVDYVLRRHPEIDPGRLGVTGTSYGGYMTNWVVTQTARFKAAVAVAGLSDLVSFYATSLYQDLVHVEFGGFPWEGGTFDLLWQRSPLRHAARVATPVLLLHGEQDNDVHITQAEEMYTALRRRGIATELVRYPREGHGFHEREHQVDAARRTVEWMDRHLGPVSAPAR